MKKNKSIKVLFLFMILFSIVFCIALLKILFYLKGTDEYKIIKEEISKCIVKIKAEDINEKENNDESIYTYKIDFKELKKRNNDTVGFIKVNGTDIENIVVQTNNNDYYLNHNYNKNQSSLGWIFVDYRNKLDGNDKNIIIYGHNMKNNMMFATLKNILTDDWYENSNNKQIIFITEDEYNVYEVFSVYEIEAENYYMMTSFNNIKFEEFVNELCNRSKYGFNVDLFDCKQILTLSTCSDNSNYRMILHAKKL